MVDTFESLMAPDGLRSAPMSLRHAACHARDISCELSGAWCNQENKTEQSRPVRPDQPAGGGPTRALPVLTALPLRL